MMNIIRRVKPETIKLVGIMALTFVASFVLGIIIGHFSRGRPPGGHPEPAPHNNYYNTLIEEASSNEASLKNLMSLVNPEMMKINLKSLTSYPHQGGTPGDLKSAEFVYNLFKSYTLDAQYITDYSVYLDFADAEVYNSIQIFNSTSNEAIPIIEYTVDKNLTVSAIFKPFLAYSKNESVSSNIFYYVNYCTESDFDTLIAVTKANLSGSIVLCRYGRMFRGNKIQLAHRYGAVGVLLYDDPVRCAPDPAFIFPRGEYIPGDSTQRGAATVNEGDPLTPNLPSTEYMFRDHANLNKVLPKIHAQVIGYDLAYRLFGLIQNTELVNDKWNGSMNMTYRYGGRLADNKTLTITVNNKPRREKTYNVIGIIKGSVEPDHYVMIGNHRDAWTFGSIDPNSGTAVLLETARVLSEMKKANQWKPKRSVIFLSWGSEEHGLIGSTEWVEEYKKKLQANSIVYLNMDVILNGNYSFGASASPLLFDFIFNVTKSIPQTPTQTIYDVWFTNRLRRNATEPDLDYLASGSDYVAFAQRIGVPSMDQFFTTNYQKVMPDVFPMYHTIHENFKFVDEIMDSRYDKFRLMALFMSESTRRLTEALILPFNCSRYARQMQLEFIVFEKEYKEILEKLEISTERVRTSLASFAVVAESFHKNLTKIDKTKYHLIRIANDQLRNVESAFLDASLRRINSYEHVVFSPSDTNAYGRNVFPNIRDAIYNHAKNPKEQHLKEKIELNFSILTYTIHSAISILKEAIDFERALF